MKKSDITLSDSELMDLKAKSRKYCVWDRACPGFGVEVTPNKIKVMVAKTCQDGQRAWHILGHYGVSGIEWTDPKTGEPRFRKWTVDDYRLKAMTLKTQVKMGQDPKAALEAMKAAAISGREAKAAADLALSMRMTVSQLADQFIREHIKAEVTRERGRMVVTKIGDPESGNRLSTAKEHIRLIEIFIRPSLGEMAVEDVRPDVIDGMLKAIRAKTPIQASRVHAVLSKMFVRAERWLSRPTGSNPVKEQDDPAPEHKRERNLSDEELVALGRALKEREPTKDADEAPSVRTLTSMRLAHLSLAAIRLALLTGMRKGEILALRHEWIDWDAKVIRIPPPNHKTGKRTKKEREVLLCEAARELLKGLPQLQGNPFVIAGRNRGALVDLQSPWEQVRKAAGLDFHATWMAENTGLWNKANATEKKAIEKMIDAHQVHLHDLRRTYSSVANRMGYPELWIGALLGHSAGTVTAGYARTNMQDHPLRQAVEALGGRIAGLLDGSIDPTKEDREPIETTGNRVV